VEPESNPSNALAKNQRLIQVGIASDPKLEAASVFVILQAIIKFLGPLIIFDRLALLFLRLVSLPPVPSAQFGQFTIPRTLRIQAQNASTFWIGKGDGPFLPFPLVLPLVLQDIGHDEERQQSYGSEDWPAALRIDVVKETEEPSRENC